MENNDFRYKRTERKILSSYLELKRKDKYADVSVRDICELSGVNRGTFYIHHKSIQDYNQYLEEKCYEKLSEATNLVYENVVFSSRPYFDMIDENRDLFEYYLNYSCGETKKKWSEDLIKNAGQKWIGLNRLTEPKLRLTLNFLIRGMEVYFECFYEYGFINKEALIESLDAMIRNAPRGLNEFLQYESK